MSLEMMTLILVGGLLALFMLGVHIGVAMGLIASLGLWLFVDQSLDQFAFSAFGRMNSFVLTAIPLFVFMGAIFQNTGVISYLFNGAHKLLGFLPGGVACSVIMANAVFGAMSGSSIAATATFGKIAFPSMEKLGYNYRLTLGTLAIGGVLSVLIPPSVILLLYAGWQNVSVARLFAGGLIPGIILALLFAITIIVMVKINPGLAPQEERYTAKEKLKALLEMLPFLAVILVVLGMLFGGIMTPTESAAVGSCLSIIVALAYRKMTFTALKESMKTAVTITAMVALLIVSAAVLAKVFQYIGLTGWLAESIGGLEIGKYGLFALICVMYLILGMFLPSIAMLLLTMPFMTPIILGMGFDLIWFGVLYVVLAEIGLISPPFGLNLFVLHGVIPQYDIMDIVRGVIPFIIPLLLMLIILTVFPQLVMWFPNFLY